MRRSLHYEVMRGGPGEVKRYNRTDLRWLRGAAENRRDAAATKSAGGGQYLAQGGGDGAARLRVAMAVGGVAVAGYARPSHGESHVI